MNFYILTLFPEMVMDGLNTSIIGRAVKNGLLSIEAVNIRDFAQNKHGQVDDYTYGGGAGLLMQTRADALCAHMVYIAETPQGEVLDMQRYGHVTMLLCGDSAFDGAVCFNEKDYAHQLTEIEI